MLLLESGLPEPGRARALVPKALDADDEDDPGPSDDDDSDEVCGVTGIAGHPCMHALFSPCHHNSLGMQDEEAELLAELARIKKEREEEAAKRAAEEESMAASNLREELIHGNPLIVGKFDNKSSDFQV